MLVPSFDPEQWTDDDLRRTLASLHVRFAWIVEGQVGHHDESPALAAEIAELLGDLAALQAHSPPEDLERHELELAVVRGEALLRHAASLVADVVPHPGGPGQVVGVFRSDGGVPKQPVDVAEIGMRGVAGDRQADRRNHGRVWQALCLWSADVIGALQAEGHPVAPGRAGENITIQGLDWSAVRPGCHLEIGGVLAEISAYASPCAKNAAWFTGRDFHRMAHDLHPGQSRVYASVLRPGTVRVGDTVTAR